MIPLHGKPGSREAGKQGTLHWYVRIGPALCGNITEIYGTVPRCTVIADATGLPLAAVTVAPRDEVTAGFLRRGSDRKKREGEDMR